MSTLAYNQTIKMKLQVLITEDQILKRVSEIADTLRHDYAGQKIILVSILKGSFVFLSDLIRYLNMPVEIDFVRMSSYGSNTFTSGKVKMLFGLKIPIEDRHVIVVEDIIDTGLTLNSLLKGLNKKRPASLKLCSLLDKPSRRRAPVQIDYLGFTIPDKFIVGYGIDYDEEFRYLRNICSIE